MARSIPQLDSGVFWKRIITSTLKEGVPDKWKESVFDGTSPVASAFVERLPVGARVLDFGSGIGRNALALARLGHSVAVCDVAEAGVRFSLDRAREQGLAVSVARCDGWTVELPDAAVDGVLAWSCLDHVTLDWATELAAELSRVARDRSAAPGVVRRGQERRPRVGVRGPGRPDPSLHLRPQGRNALQALLER